MEILKRTGTVVKLSIVRYLRGLKFEELQEGITQANVATPTSPYPQTPVTPQGSSEDVLMSDERLNNSQATVSALLMRLNKPMAFRIPLSFDFVVRVKWNFSIKSQNI